MKIHQGSLYGQRISASHSSSAVLTGRDSNVPSKRLPGSGLNIALVAQPVEILEIVPGFDDPERLHGDDGDDEGQLTPSGEEWLDFPPRDDVVELV